MKRILALALCLVMVFALTASMAQGEQKYDQHVSFTASQYSQISEAGDYTHDDVYYKLQEMFNFDWELYALDAASWHDKNTMWITAGTMPDVLFFDFNTTEYYAYAEQELIKALPDGWETTYPNLFKQIQATGIADAIKVNGKTYAIPHVINYLVAPDNFVFTYHNLFYYRLDWAKGLGYDFGVSCTMTEWENYLRDCMAKYNCKGMVTMSGAKNLVRLLMYQFSKGFDKIYKDAATGEYVLGFAQEGTIEGIKHLRKMYEEGLFDAEFYLGADTIEFSLNNSPAVDYWGGAPHPQQIAQWMINNKMVPDLEAAKSIFATVTVTDDNGVYHAANTNANFCFATLFNPELDDVTFDRILAMYDYFATLEGFELSQLGIRGVDWEKDEQGNYTLICPEILDGTYANIREKYPSMYYLYLRNVLSDSAAYIDPMADKFFLQMSNDMYNYRKTQDIVPYDPDYSFHSSDAKSQYSVDWRQEVLTLMLDSSLDIETEVNRFIEENRPLWEPLLNELNEKF